MTRHKHAELIKAWADGARIQIKPTPPDSAWVDIQNPGWYDDTEYRVKPAEIPEGFIPWDGGNCPVESYRIVEIIMRDGERDIDLAGAYRWQHADFEGDIIAYKVVKKEPVVRWQWIVKDRWRKEKPSQTTTGFYKDEEEVKSRIADQYIIIGKAEWTRTEFDE